MLCVDILLIRRVAPSTQRICIPLAPSYLSLLDMAWVVCVCILDSLIGTVAKWESSEVLALSRWCYVTGMEPGLDRDLG